jgi:VWFA-related protein
MPAKWPVAALLLAAAPALAEAAVPGFPDDPPRRYQDTVSAERVVVDVHAIDNAGEPVLGLSASDFTLRVDGKPVPIESVEWIAGSSSATVPHAAAQAARATAPETSPVPAPAGRMIVLFFQTDYELSRITGQMRMIRQALAFLASCAPEDRLAVLSFDSRLKLRQDFTNDREKIRRAIVRTLYADRTIDPAPGPTPSLAASIDFSAARRATLPEHALGVIGQGLGAIPGSKSLLYFGWGLGNFDSVMGLILDHNYARARAALVRSHTSVFVLDVTTADFHSMQGGLEAIADDTGGFYVKTHVFPMLAMQKVARAISGYYLLTFERPPIRRGRHEMSIRLTGRPKISVLARPDYQD